MLHLRGGGPGESLWGELLRGQPVPRAQQAGVRGSAWGRALQRSPQAWAARSPAQAGASAGSVSVSILTQGGGLRHLRTERNCRVVERLPCPVGSRDPVQWGEWQAPRDVPGTRDCELIWEKALQC